MQKIALEDLEITVAPVGSSNTVTGLPCVRIIIWYITKKKLYQSAPLLFSDTIAIVLFSPPYKNAKVAFVDFEVNRYFFMRLYTEMVPGAGIEPARFD